MNNLRLPDFICIGVQKSGTTSLHDILKDHPQIFLPESKEANFFDKDEVYEKGITQWLKINFDGVSNDEKSGVFTPDYIFYPYVAERIAQAYGNDSPKFIVILRHPIDRAFSHYLMSKRRGYETESFENAIELEEERLKSREYYQVNHFSYLSRGRYLEQIERYLERFDRSNFLFLCFEDHIKKNLPNTLETIESFISVSHAELNSEKHSNYASGVRSKSIQTITRGDNSIKRILKKILSPKIRRNIKKKVIELNENKVEQIEKLDLGLRDQLMKKYFIDEIEKLEMTTGLNLSAWRIND